ncbi:LysM peptidoglycan-binding domain-containing protein [Aquimarina sp. AD10]|uniref:glucosaminidase domain-containing protein n=1 Tax=Aquimarina TaxID=290174 RepID=UPI000E508709|nr:MULTISPECIES: glucosaminidase domain-containing protein [Aquimarina]AXT62820.1 LysM peptidoglycan-binding domain-containing protein [Aquimarina sp. AD10]RKN02004.1 LysM peptidoglycan-binding domain-containing protein [Aquimarina sp. AD10]
MRKFISLVCVTVFLISCGGNKKVLTTSSKTKRATSKQTTVTKIERNTREIVKEETPTSVKRPPKAALPYKERVRQYIFEFSEIAKSEMKTYGIPASITLAQGILESGAGYGDLTTRAKNHFGIKCHDWTGDRVYHDDDRLQECFRKYDQASDSFRDHSLFLKNRKRYARLFTFSKKDYKSWARGLREAGYATDKKYPQKLIAIIEQYRLYEFDNDVLGRKKRPKKEKITEAVVTTPQVSKPVISTISALTATTKKGEHEVINGDTLYSISRKYKISVEELKAFNKLVNNNIKVGQVLKVAKINVDEEEEDFN